MLPRLLHKPSKKQFARVFVWEEGVDSGGKWAGGHMHSLWYAKCSLVVTCEDGIIVFVLVFTYVGTHVADMHSSYHMQRRIAVFVLFFVYAGIAVAYTYFSDHMPRWSCCICTRNCVRWD